MTCSRSQSQLSRELFLLGVEPKDILFRAQHLCRPCSSPWPSLIFMITAPVPRNASLATLASRPASAQLSKLCSQAVTHLKPGLSIGTWSFLYDMEVRFHSPALSRRQLVSWKEQDVGARQFKVEIQLDKHPHLPELPFHHL